MVILAGQGRERSDARNAAQLDVAVHSVQVGAGLLPRTPRPFPPGPQPVEGVLVDVKEIQTGQSPARGPIAHEVGGEAVETLAQVGNAALQPVDGKAQVGELAALAGAQFKEFAAVVPSQLVVVLAGAVDDHPVDLGIAVYQALHVGGGAAVEHHDMPAAPGGVR